MLINSPFNDSSAVFSILNSAAYIQLALPYPSSSLQVAISVIEYYHSWPRYDQQKDLARTSLRISCGMLVITPRTTSKSQVPGQHITYVFVIEAFSLNQFVFYKVCLQDLRLVTCCSSTYFITTKLEQAYAHHLIPRNYAARIQSNTHLVEQTLQLHSICPSGAHLVLRHSIITTKKKPPPHSIILPISPNSLNTQSALELCTKTNCVSLLPTTRRQHLISYTQHSAGKS
jgi:hypothetical protein